MPFSKKSLAINCEMVQERWVIHPSMAKKTAELTTKHGVIISCPNPLFMNRIRTNDRMI